MPSNKITDFKIGMRVEVLVNSTSAYNHNENRYFQRGDSGVITEIARGYIAVNNRQHADRGGNWFTWEDLRICGTRCRIRKPKESK